MRPTVRRHGRRHTGLLALVAGLLTLLIAAQALAIVRVPAQPSAVRGNPADALGSLAIEGSSYDRATRCAPGAKRPGMAAFAAWLSRHARGASWGTYRCEKWGKGSASLHAEGRALDWHLSRSSPADAREARRLILLLLAPDRAGNEQALARRMGVQEIIWDCGYWSAGMTDFKKYRACYSKSGRLRKKVNVTVAHRDHIHFGMTKAGATKKTSFWTRRAARPADQGTGPSDDWEDEGWDSDEEILDEEILAEDPVEEAPAAEAPASEDEDPAEDPSEDSWGG